MCGLVGIAGALEYKDEEIFQRLLLSDFWRGKDSTGMAAVRRSDEVHLAKLHSHPIDLFDMGKFKNALSGHNSKAFIGHNRAATSGKVSMLNTHPFMFNHIVGAHNGTLPISVHRQLEKIVDEQYPVDSMALLSCISKIGIKETIEQIKGSWALVWFNLANNSINFLRNDARPLWYAWSEDFKKIFWASEWRMIDGAVNGGGGKLYKREKDGAVFFPVPANQHFMLPLESLMAGGKSPPKFKTKEVKEDPTPEPETTYTMGYRPHGHNVDPFGRDAWEEEWENHVHGRNNVLPFDPRLGSAGVSEALKRGNGRTGSRSNRNTGSNNENYLFLEGTKSEPFAGRLSRTEFDNIACAGCQWCGKDVNWGDLGIAIYTKEEIVLCREHSPNGHEKGNRLYITGSVAA